jgi:hypothetical protein
MHLRLSIRIAAIGLLVAAVPAPAHHAFAAEFNSDKPIALRGTVTMMEWMVYCAAWRALQGVAILSSSTKRSSPNGNGLLHR